ncbi:Peptidoglycan/LPS O-acetylase OafA/YrhL, contains acyltransferase and SGNH-hydrolase domains [Curtobacterium sp. UNCCL20]|uniref:acyltransferase family protein n=1 Tax=Curtobacterium sp. UNCCL20 TaxID=1502773 RepID=UPI00087E3E1B|nr:acyltransferase family protein [Curtobacterium sp. UNCCL20]SDR04689.1 Peptidoglycan/LPS O-acetylase OafA/YrhL, contains acyltransferase and SGNH-hydrolase domains [Curtobacterium sp. UNCCL20]
MSERLRIRSDVQGLRALAVLAVVSDHVLGAPRGGFLGVDVFFVVSGFVITAQLLREHEERGRVSLPRFWGRRVTRLLPSLLTVVLVTVAVVAATVPGRLRGVLLDSAAAVTSLANWRFMANGTDYFASFESASPLQHTWSLSVEEQFYVVWPMLLAACLWFGALRLGRRRRPLGPAVTLTAVAIGVMGVSIAAAVLASPVPSTAYFSTVTRVWELLAGALVAVLLQRRPATDRSRAAAITAPAGLALIVVSFVVVDGTVSAPLPAALGAVLGTCLVLSHGAASPLGHVLGVRPLVTIGNASYPLYLWHMPVLVLLTAVLPTSRWLVIPLTVVLAVLTHLLVEEPIRVWGRRDRRSPHRQPRASRRQRLVVCATASVTLFALTGTAIATHEPARPVPVAAPTDAAGPAAAALQEDLAVAIGSSDWPVGDLRSGDAVLDGVRRCGDWERPAPPSHCTFGPSDAARTAVLVGDSIAGAWLEALVPLFGPTSGWRLVALPRNGCPFVDLELAGTPGRDCSTERSRVLDAIRSMHPDLVITSSRDGAQFAAPSGTGTADDDEVAHAAARMLLRVGDLADRVVVVTAPPPGADLRACRTTIGGPADCVATVRRGPRERVLAGAARGAGASVVDATRLVAVAERTPAFVGTLALRDDRVHLSPAFSRSIGPALAELLAEVGVRFD